MLRWLPVLLLLACQGRSDSDSGPTADTAQDSPSQNTGFSCEDEDLEIDPLGPSDPAVGDEWTVWLRCNGTTLTGTMVLQFDPPEFAAIDTNIVTFLMAGTAEMTVQVGSYRAYTDVTVTE